MPGLPVVSCMPQTVQLTENYFYFTIEKPSVAEFKDRGSKFTGYVFPVSSKEDFKEQLHRIKELHPKATHHCFAYRLGTNGNEFRLSDDGEPSGSAGRPIMGQIESRELTNTLVFVVRYFGGSQLGIPGLINAYKTAAALALDASPVIRKQVIQKYLLSFDYTKLNDIMMVVKKFHCSILRQDLQLFCNMTLGIPFKNLEEVISRFKEIHSLEIKKSE